MNERAIKMISVAGFISVFEAELKRQTTETYKQIFDRINDEYLKVFGVTRYSSYDSFDRVRRRKIKS